MLFLYLVEGDYLNAALSATSMIPVVGSGVVALKISSKVVKAEDVISGAIKVLNKESHGAILIKTNKKTEKIVELCNTGCDEFINKFGNNKTFVRKITDEEVQESIKADRIACFTEDTLIEIKNGHKKILEIKEGDEVYSENPETGEKGLKKVSKVIKNEVKFLRHIFVDDKEIKVSRRHPFYVQNKGWIEARQIKINDELHLFSGEIAKVKKVQDEVLNSPILVYNFEVEDFQTYFVSELDILVHNACSVQAKGYYKPKKD